MRTKENELAKAFELVKFLSVTLNDDHVELNIRGNYVTTTIYCASEQRKEYVLQYVLRNVYLKIDKYEVLHIKDDEFDFFTIDFYNYWEKSPF